MASSYKKRIYPSEAVSLHDALEPFLFSSKLGRYLYRDLKNRNGDGYFRFVNTGDPGKPFVWKRDLKKFRKTFLACLDVRILEELTDGVLTRYGGYQPIARVVNRICEKLGRRVTSVNRSRVYNLIRGDESLSSMLVQSLSGRHFVLNHDYSFEEKLERKLGLLYFQARISI